MVITSYRIHPECMALTEATAPLWWAGSINLTGAGLEMVPLLPFKC